MKATHTVIIDIGKTHIKLHVLNDAYQSVFSTEMDNEVDTSKQYPCTDVNKVWSWLSDNIKNLAADYTIEKITTTTHGATAALIDRNATTEDGLVLPVLDYESPVVNNKAEQYEAIRADFSDTLSPALPVGLNLGRQIHWLKETYPEEFSKATDILMYPQYWVWRFTGQCFSEITSLGCHTDLWSIADNKLSKLVENMGCEALFPELKPAWHDCGVIKPSVASALGLSESCRFYSGIHDSNASFLRYRLAQGDNPFTVVSTGTWTILMATQVPLDNLNPERDMLANIDALGSPVACARFMGGREFAAICEQTSASLSEQFGTEDLQDVIDKSAFALPNFSDGSGPFGNRTAEFVGPTDKVRGIALATLYCALMIDYQLSQLDAKGEIYIEGAFLKNPLLCAIVNQLRGEQKVRLSLDSTGTVLGAAYLTNWGEQTNAIELEDVPTLELSGLIEYRELWLSLIG